MATVPELVDRAATWFASDVAVSDGDRDFSFHDVGERSSRAANMLTGLNPSVGTRVAVLLPNRAECVEIDFAISKAGKVRVPVNSRLAADERKYVLRDAAADIVITDVDGATFLLDEKADLDEVKTVVVLDATNGSLGQGYEALLKQASVRPPSLRLRNDDPSYILYTSGTSGRPKGAVTTNRGRLTATATMLAEELDVEPGGAMAHVASMAHGSGSKTLAYFYRGARNVTLSKWDPEQFLRLAETQRITGTFLVPTMLSALVDAIGPTGEMPPTFQTLSYGGAPISQSLWRRASELIGPRMVQVYGSCEAPHPVLLLPKSDHDPTSVEGRQRQGAVGRPTLNWRISLRDQDGQRVPDGATGELWVCGPGVMAGYWRDDDATAEVIRDGWYRTGDIVRRDADGYIHLVDRARELIITGGLNVYPAEVERVIHELPEVSEVVVFGIPDDTWGESIKAVIAIRPGTSLTSEAVITHCRARLASYKKPTSISFADELPKGPTGKISKRSVRDAHWPTGAGHV